jgi:hypothetical protein
MLNVYPSRIVRWKPDRFTASAAPFKSGRGMNRPMPKIPRIPGGSSSFRLKSPNPVK